MAGRIVSLRDMEKLSGSEIEYECKAMDSVGIDHGLGLFPPIHCFPLILDFAPRQFSLSRNDTILPAMSMFHANAWGLPQKAVMNRSRLVLPGPNLQPEKLFDLPQ